MRVIDQDGNQLGILPTQEALGLAQEAGLNLVEVNAKTQPPVCKILDYGKFKYENAKRERESKKTRKTQELKEVKFRPKTHDHDFEFKTNHVRRFLEDGNKVKLLIQFRGREVTHPETGRAVIDRVVREVADIAAVNTMAQMEGNRMSMILAPKPQKGGSGGSGGGSGSSGGGGSRPANTSDTEQSDGADAKSDGDPSSNSESKADMDAGGDKSAGAGEKAPETASAKSD